jgi:RES domain-containing protein
MRLWRLCRDIWSATAFDGEGARRYPGRWNQRGVAAVYVAATISLAVLEYLVHADADLIPDGSLVVIPVDIPATTRVDSLEVRDVPTDWRRFPHSERTRELGTAWLDAGEAVALSLPSAVVPRERIVVLNPRHRDLSQLVVGAPEPFALDPRLW